MVAVKEDTEGHGGKGKFKIGGADGCGVVKGGRKEERAVLEREAARWWRGAGWPRRDWKG